MKRIALWGGGAVLLLAAAAAAVYGPRAIEMMGVGAGYVAKQMCSCVYVAERDFDQCRLDIPTSMEDIAAQRLEERPGMRAHILGVERLALHTPGAGCRLLP